MPKETRYQYMAFNVKVLKVLKLWLEDGENDENKWRNKKTYFVIATLFPSWGPVLLRCCLAIAHPDADIIFKITQFLGNVCVMGAIYMGICFVQNRKQIKDLLKSIDNFASYSDLNLTEVDRKATFYSKLFMGYSQLGTVIYTSASLLAKATCEEKKSKYEVERRIPCGLILVAKYPFNYDVSPIFEIIACHQMITAGVAALIVSNVTMLICGVLEHAINQLIEVRKCIVNISQVSNEKTAESVRFAVKYHCAVIKFIGKINAFFGSQLVLHFTLTSVVISLLGFKILVENDRNERIMYAMHLLGWLIMLFNICHYGQRLIDESAGVGEDAYSVSWYDTPVSIQKEIKLIILRAQKPLTLNALSLGILSNSTFLAVISSSYSYFTLLLKVKK